MTKPTNDTDLFREAQTGQDKREHQKIVNRVFISAGDSIWPPLYQLRMSLYRLTLLTKIGAWQHEKVNVFFTDWSPVDVGHLCLRKAKIQAAF